VCDYDEINESSLGICGQNCVAYESLDEALKNCCSVPDCYGVTYSNEKFETWGY